MSVKTAIPYFTQRQFENINEISEIANNLPFKILTSYHYTTKLNRIRFYKNILLIWRLAGIKRAYYLSKQYAFQGINLIYALNVKIFYESWSNWAL